MNIFSFRRQVVEDYADYTRSFIQILDPRLNAFVDEQLRAGVLWPEPLIQLNPSFEPGAWIDDLVNQAVLHRECGRVFRIKPQRQDEGATFDCTVTRKKLSALHGKGTITS